MSGHNYIHVDELEAAVEYTQEALQFLARVTDRREGLDITSTERGMCAVFWILANYLGNAIHEDNEEKAEAKAVEESAKKGGGS